MTFWVPIPFVVTICRYLGSITLFARILKPVPTVFWVAGFHTNCMYSGRLWHKEPFAQMNLWVPISFAATFCCPLCSIALFAQILKPVPMVYGVACFHCTYGQGGDLFVTCSFILKNCFRVFHTIISLFTINKLKTKHTQLQQKLQNSSYVALIVFNIVIFFIPSR